LRLTTFIKEFYDDDDDDGCNTINRRGRRIVIFGVAVVISSLLYAASAWCMGFTTAANHQRIDDFIGVRTFRRQDVSPTNCLILTSI